MVIEVGTNTIFNFEDVFTENQIREIINSSFGLGHDCKFVRGEVKAPLPDGVVDYLSEHLRAILHVTVNGSLKQIHVFVKRLPHQNESKCKIIKEFNFFERESITLNFIKKLEETNELGPWHTKPYICNESIIVMPDLGQDGYNICDRQESLDIEHMLVAAATLARFHAATANFETNKYINTGKARPIIEEIGFVLKEKMFIESPFIETSAQLTVKIIDEFSLKYKNKIQKQQEKIAKLFIQACDSLKETDTSLNVLLHKDLWSNNIMFKYEESKPTNAILIDYQLVRYGPPAFDLMVLLYMNSSKTFRQQFELKIFEHYFSAFVAATNNSTKDRLKTLKYDFEEFKKWCDKSRMFALLQAIAFLPYTLMSSDAVQKSLNDPDKFSEYTQSDRSGPVIDHAKESITFKERLLEVNEEFVERFIL